MTLEVQVGNNAAPTTGDPKYIGEFYVESYVLGIETGKAVQFTATLNPAIGVAPSPPSWTVV